MGCAQEKKPRKGESGEGTAAMSNLPQGSPASPDLRISQGPTGDHRAKNTWETLPEALPPRLVYKGLAHSTSHTNTNPPQGLPRSLHPDMKCLASADCPGVWTVCGLNAYQGKVNVNSLRRVRLFCDPMNCGLPGSSVHGIFQTRDKGRKCLRTESRGNCACVGRKSAAFRQLQKPRVATRASGPEPWGSRSTSAKIQGHAACMGRFIARSRGPASVRCLKGHQ